MTGVIQLTAVLNERDTCQRAGGYGHFELTAQAKCAFTLIVPPSSSANRLEMLRPRPVRHIRA